MRLCSALLAAAPLIAARPVEDRKHFSKVFNEQRNYRILLPGRYEESARRYPVIYYFHGHSDRYTVEHYDNGKDTIPKMAEFVAQNPTIVVAVDGYVANAYQGFYGGDPWDIRKEGGQVDFGEYFQELAAHIDSTYRTLSSRRFRATSGLSMGGFMSLWLSARYPSLIGSASAFNPGPEFYTGDHGSRILWRPKDHTASHKHTMVRLIRASGDYISQYHEETKDAYARNSNVPFEFRQDEYNRHWATSIGETFAFHMRAFANSALDNVPVSWSYANPHREFEVWNYNVESRGPGSAITYLEDVAQGGVRIRTRRWAPDGPAAERKIMLATASVYQPGFEYELIDHAISSGKTLRAKVKADAEGRLRFQVDGAGHQISFVGPGTGADAPVLLPNALMAWPGRATPVPIRIYNPRAAPMTEVSAELTTAYPTVNILKRRVTVAKIESGSVADLSADLAIEATSGDGYLAPARLELKLTYDGWHTATEEIDVQIVPSIIPRPLAAEVFDGRKVTLPVFLQKGNQGGGSLVLREINEGKGNGNGILEPGEEATIWVKLEQGLDPFDKNSWHRARVVSASGYLTETDLIEEPKQREWTSAQSRASVVSLSSAPPKTDSVPVLLEFESWSFHWTPEVRYGPEPLYQAFQLHRRHLAQWTVYSRQWSNSDK